MTIDLTSGLFFNKPCSNSLPRELTIPIQTSSDVKFFMLDNDFKITELEWTENDNFKKKA
jgi:hypothetical protein